MNLILTCYSTWESVIAPIIIVKYARGGYSIRTVRYGMRAKTAHHHFSFTCYYFLKSTHTATQSVHLLLWKQAINNGTSRRHDISNRTRQSLDEVTVLPMILSGWRLGVVGQVGHLSPSSTNWVEQVMSTYSWRFSQLWWKRTDDICMERWKGVSKRKCPVLESKFVFWIRIFVGESLELSEYSSGYSMSCKN